MGLWTVLTVIVATAAVTAVLVAVLLRRLGGSDERAQARLAVFAEQVDRREERLDRRDAELERRAEALADAEAALAGMTAEDACKQLLDRAEEQAARTAERIIADAEVRARREAEQRARLILASAIERFAGSTTEPATTVVVPVPDMSMKSRVIGREGRNIRTFEQVTGANLVVDDVAEGILLSCFDPVRRETARLALTDLIADGRIHPSFIHEAYDRAVVDVEKLQRDAAKEAAAELGIANLDPELLRLLGVLHLRTSHGQTVLRHSVETAVLAGLMAHELGADAQLARRAGLLHDIGKALPHDVQGSHARVGAMEAARLGESEEVCHIIESHHGEVDPATIEAVLVQAADQISFTRPGARREQLQQHMTRMRNIEEICAAYEGVARAYAMQAGRDIHVVVRPEVVDDEGARKLARRIAQRLYRDPNVPAQATITVVRETRAVEISG